MLSRKAVCLWLLAGAVCLALAAGGAGLAQQSGPGEPAADPFIAAQPGGPIVAQSGGAVAAIGGSPPPAKRPPEPFKAVARAEADREAAIARAEADREGVARKEADRTMVEWPDGGPVVQVGAEGVYGGYGVYGGAGRGAVMYGTREGGVGAPYRYMYATAGPQRPDPEIEQLLKKDTEMEVQVQVLVKEWHEQKDEKVRGDLRSQVEKLTKEHFDLRQQRRELELSRLEAQLERVRASVKKRSEVKDLIIQRRIARLLGEEDDFAF